MISALNRFVDLVEKHLTEEFDVNGLARARSVYRSASEDWSSARPRPGRKLVDSPGRKKMPSWRSCSPTTERQRHWRRLRHRRRPCDHDLRFPFSAQFSSGLAVAVSGPACRGRKRRLG